MRGGGGRWRWQVWGEREGGARGEVPPEDSKFNNECRRQLPLTWCLCFISPASILTQRLKFWNMVKLGKMTKTYTR